jgi:LPS-assembly protein
VNRSKRRKINVKTAPTIVVGIVLLLLTFQWESRAILRQNAPVFIDTTIKKPIQLKDSLVNKADSLINKTDTLILSKDSIDAPIDYNASDSGVLIVDTREFLLYGKAKTNYQDLKIEAATIRYNQQSKMVKAYGSTDSSGKLDSKPVFMQGEMKSISDTISFNMETGKGLTKNTFFQEGEIFVNAISLKKMNDSVVYAKKARFTTCNLDTPHFAFRTGRMKIINNKLGISGPTFPEFEGVPMPIGIPFGIFPLNRGRHSGILAPAFTASEDFGLGLEGLGYYKVINDYLDFTTRANIYSYGGWNVNLNSKYIKRYAFTGGFNLTLQNTKSLNRFGGTGDEFNQSKSFMLNWSHSRDNRARPGTSFSANVNFGSSRFNRLLLNNPMQNFQNQLSSSISYSKDWRGKYNLSVNANHNQNNNLRLVNLQLPTLNFNVVTLYPFQSKEQIGAGKWYEKIGIGYSGNVQNQLSFYDTAFNFKRLLDTAQWGAVHNIPISMSLPALGPVTISPSISYEERWYGQRFIRSWNSANKKVDTVKYRGLFTARQMSFGISAATRIFGTYTFGKNSNIKGIRHEMRPTVSVNYQPDMAAAYHYSTQIDTTGRRIRFSQYEGGVIGSFSEGRFGGIGFGIDNLLEMKVRDKSDSTAKDKKIKLIEGFGISSSYNMLADSFKLGTFNLYARSTLFEKVNINASATLDPYDVDKMGYRLKTYAFDPKAFKFGRITSGSIAISTSFSSKSKDGKTEKDRAIPIDPFLTPDEQQRQLQFAKSNPAEFTDFNIPWTLSFSYSLSFNRQLKPDYSGFETRTFSSLNFNGDFSLSEKWKVGGTGYYDVSMGGLQQFSMFISREMHCWQMSINVMPVGIFRSFNITVNPKSGILRDLKINRSRVFSNSTF